MRERSIIAKDYNRAEQELESIRTSDLSLTEKRIAMRPINRVMHELRQECMQTYSEREQLAIHLHKSLCTRSHAYQCDFYKEVKGVADDWCGLEHLRWLKKADAMVALVSVDKSPEQVVYDIIAEISV